MERNHFEYLGVDGRILKKDLTEIGFEDRTGLM
jgi:hypothetical protein